MRWTIPFTSFNLVMYSGSNNSGIPPVLNQIQGNPVLIASTTARGKPSVMLGCT